MVVLLSWMGRYSVAFAVVFGALAVLMAAIGPAPEAAAWVVFSGQLSAALFALAASLFLVGAWLRR